MIRMKNVTEVYDSSGTVALDGIDLKIDEGEFVFLVGPSGSGKTTLMKLITGEVRPTNGTVIVNDFDMSKIRRRKLPKMRRTLGVVFQDYRLIENMSVYDNVAFAMRVVGAPTGTSASACPMCWSWWAWRAARSACPTSCPAASSSVWPSPALWSIRRACWWRTSRPAIWIRFAAWS